jgi:hypothetical protein
MLALGLSNDAEHLRAVIGEIAAIPMDDGVSFDPTTISVDPRYFCTRLSIRQLACQEQYGHQGDTLLDGDSLPD